MLSRARAIARYLPDCVLLLRRLMADRRVSRVRKALLALLVGYLAMPFDLIPDFIPVVGLIDDALLVAIVLRSTVRGAGPELVSEHWPGPPESLDAILRLAGSR
jgi:uncharacterized membrane protein YkvA (DUF1232 family)